MYSLRKETPIRSTEWAVVIDIDETLIYSTPEIEQIKKTQILSKENLSTLHRLFTMKFEDGAVWGITRPFAKEFVGFCRKFFKTVIIWSAGEKEYVHNIVKFLFRDIDPPDLIYTRNDCMFVKKEPKLKPLSKLIQNEPQLNLKEATTLFIDDREHTFVKNPDNAIHIPEFSPVNYRDSDSEEESPEMDLSKIKLEDDSLLKIVLWLKKNAAAEDVRLLDKKSIFA